MSSTTRSYFDPNGFDFSQYPPAPILWVTYAVDTICMLPLHCSDWRTALSIPEDSWFAAKVPSLLVSLPQFTTYAEFLSSKQIEASSSFDVKYSWSLLYEFAFETSSTALSELTTWTSLWTLLGLVLLLRTLKNRLLLPVFCQFGRRIGRATHGRQWEKENEVRITKFGEYVFRLCYHSMISAYGIVYFYDKSWWAGKDDAELPMTMGTITLFRGFPYHPVEPGMAWYYLLQSAYNLDAMITLLELSFCIHINWDKIRFWKKRPKILQQPNTSDNLLPLDLPINLRWSSTVRGDFREMFVHHVVTNLLIFGSSRCRFTRIGSMVFMVHDISDVPVDLSKLANFLKWKQTTIVCFISMVLVWMLTRLYVLPFIIYHAVLTQSHYVMEQGLSPLLYISYRYFFYVLIGFLILLHLSWFGMFIQMFLAIVQKNEVHDLSEHKQGEDQSVFDKKKTRLEEKKDE